MLEDITLKVNGKPHKGIINFIVPYKNNKSDIIFFLYRTQ